jgi:GT2 family glycosyltransferase
MRSTRRSDDSCQIGTEEMELRNQIAVVVIGRNEGQRLLACLASLNELRASTIYVDSGSTDGSIAAAGELGVHVVKLELTEAFSPGRARNEGFNAARRLHPEARFVQFLDGDCILDCGWLKNALDFISDRQEIAVVCGRRREKAPNESVYNRICDIEWNTPVGETSACGGDSLMRISAFEQVGGFSIGLIAGEEPELCGRLRQHGWTIWRLPYEMTRHDAAIHHFRQWWRRAVRSGYAEAEISWRYKSARSEAVVEKKQVVRMLLWAVVLPAGAILGSLLSPLFLLGLLAYPIQIGRVALLGPTKSDRWAYASLMMMAKFAGLRGMLRFIVASATGSSKRLIEYKNT